MTLTTNTTRPSLLLSRLTTTTVTVSLQMIQLYPPIFVNVEFSRSFVTEYPVCATEKNIVVPYPTTDPDLLSGMFFEKNMGNNAKKLGQGKNHRVMIGEEKGIVSNQVTTTNNKANNEGNKEGHGEVGLYHARDKLLFYQGGMHGSCEDIRRALVAIMRDPRGRWAAQKGDRKREEGFLTARYCPIPVGDSPSSKRMYDVMHVSLSIHTNTSLSVTLLGTYFSGR